MGDSSRPSPGLCLCREFKQDPAPRAKRVSDSAAQLQALQSAKKACVLSRSCSTPDPAGNPLFPSPGSGFSLFLDESGHDGLADSFSASKYNDVAISMGVSGRFDDSELDDSLLELSGSEKGNSPFDYTEEEIQEMLADDCTEAEQQHLAGESHLSRNVSGESDEAESSSCTAGTSVSEAASEVTEEHPSAGSGGDPGFLTGNAALDGAQLQQELDLDLQELLNLNPFAAACSDEALGYNYPGEVEMLEAMIDDCLNSTAAGSCIPKESSEGVMPKGQESLAQDYPGRSMLSSDLPCGQGTGDESPASVPPSKKDLPKATTSCSSRKSGSPEGAEGESAGAEQPSGSTKLSNPAVGQTGQEETTSGKKSGKVIPVPQEKEERPKQRTCISEVQPEQKKRFFPGCANPNEEKCSYFLSGVIQEPPTAGVWKRRCCKEQTAGPAVPGESLENLPSSQTTRGFLKNASKNPFQKYPFLARSWELILQLVKESRARSGDAVFPGKELGFTSLMWQRGKTLEFRLGKDTLCAVLSKMDFSKANIPGNWPFPELCYVFRVESRPSWSPSVLAEQLL